MHYCHPDIGSCCEDATESRAVNFISGLSEYTIFQRLRRFYAWHRKRKRCHFSGCLSVDRKRIPIVKKGEFLSESMK